MATIKTVDDVFTELGGPTALARLLNLKGASTASEMRRRGSIPVEYWQRLVAVAAKAGHPELSYDQLVSMHSSKERVA